MMITTKGEDYMTLAEAKGLNSKRIFFNYGVRNAILPQVTALALSLSHIISGAILVEIVFSYPGIGSLLYQGIKAFDYFIIQGVVFILVISIAFSMLLIDLIYPLIDPRVKIRNTTENLGNFMFKPPKKSILFVLYLLYMLPIEKNNAAEIIPCDIIWIIAP